MPSGKVWADVGTIICGPPAWFSPCIGAMPSRHAAMLTLRRAEQALHEIIEMMVGVYNSK